MQPTTEAELLARHNRSRLWMVRITLCSLLSLLVLAVVFLVLTSSSDISIAEAKVLYAQLGRKTERSEVMRLLGKPSREKRNGIIAISNWFFAKHHLNQTDFYMISLVWNDEGSVANLLADESTVKGWEAWIGRWRLLRIKMGFEED